MVLSRLLGGFRDKMAKVSLGPPISAFPEIDNYDEVLANYSLEPLKPRVTAYPDRYLLKANDIFPNPKEVSPTDVDIISYMFDIPGVEPQLGFGDYIKGVACASQIAPLAAQEALKAALMTVAVRVVDQGELPSLSGEFTGYIQKAVHVILNNNEPSGWRGLLAFMQGAYWLLGFIDQPFAQKGKRIAPVEFVDLMVTHYSQLGYVPR